MKMQRSIRIFISILLLASLGLSEKIVIHEIVKAQTFGIAHLFFGLAIFGLASLTMVILILINEIETWRFERLVCQGDNKLAAGQIEFARQFYLEAQRLNDRWMTSRNLSLLILRKLLDIHRLLDDKISYADCEHRIQAIESVANVPRLEQRMLQESLASEEEAISSQIKRPENYIIAGTFALGLFIFGWYFAPPQSGFPIINDVLLRLAGTVLTIFTIAEALAGKAHGGAGPTAYWNKTPFWFAFRAGCFLFFGVMMTLRFDRFGLTKGYWQMPADLQTGLISSGSLAVCCLACYILAYLKNDKSSSG